MPDARSDMLTGRAARIVAPIQSAEGHVLYWARFGPFIEHQAREVCELLTVRGRNMFRCSFRSRIEVNFLAPGAQHRLRHAPRPFSNTSLASLIRAAR